MTDASIGPLSPEEARVRDAADQAYSVLRGEEPPARDATAQLLEILRNRTRQAPLRALAAAFFLGVILARRR